MDCNSLINLERLENQLFAYKRNLKSEQRHYVSKLLRNQLIDSKAIVKIRRMDVQCEKLLISLKRRLLLLQDILTPKDRTRILRKKKVEKIEPSESNDVDEALNTRKISTEKLKSQQANSSESKDVSLVFEYANKSKQCELNEVVEESYETPTLGIKNHEQEFTQIIHDIMTETCINNNLTESLVSKESFIRYSQSSSEKPFAQNTITVANVAYNADSLSKNSKKRQTTTKRSNERELGKPPIKRQRKPRKCLVYETRQHQPQQNSRSNLAKYIELFANDCNQILSGTRTSADSLIKSQILIPSNTQYLNGDQQQLLTYNIDGDWINGGPCRLVAVDGTSIDEKQPHSDEIYTQFPDFTNCIDISAERSNKENSSVLENNLPIHISLPVPDMSYQNVNENQVPQSMEQSTSTSITPVVNIQIPNLPNIEHYPPPPAHSRRDILNLTVKTKSSENIIWTKVMQCIHNPNKIFENVCHIEEDRCMPLNLSLKDSILKDLSGTSYVTVQNQDDEEKFKKACNPENLPNDNDKFFKGVIDMQQVNGKDLVQMKDNRISDDINNVQDNVIGNCSYNDIITYEDAHYVLLAKSNLTNENLKCSDQSAAKICDKLSKLGCDNKLSNDINRKNNYNEDFNKSVGEIAGNKLEKQSKLMVDAFDDMTGCKDESTADLSTHNCDVEFMCKNHQNITKYLQKNVDSVESVSNSMEQDARKISVDEPIIQGSSISGKLALLESTLGDSLDFENDFDDALSLATSCFDSPKNSNFQDSAVDDTKFLSQEKCAKCPSIDLEVKNGINNCEIRKTNNCRFIPTEESVSTNINKLMKTVKNDSTHSLTVTQKVKFLKNENYAKRPLLTDLTEGTSTLSILHKVFGITCLPYLVDKCYKITSCKLSHEFNDHDSVYKHLSALSKSELSIVYRFQYQHLKLYKEYFKVFCTYYTTKNDQKKLLNMVNDCERYPEYAEFIIDIYEGLNKCGLSRVNACSQILKQIREFTTAPVIDVLVAIIIKSDWTMFTDYIDKYTQEIYQYNYRIGILDQMAPAVLNSKDSHLKQVFGKCVQMLHCDDTGILLHSPRIIQCVSLLTNS